MSTCKVDFRKGNKLLQVLEKQALRPRILGEVSSQLSYRSTDEGSSYEEKKYQLRFDTKKLAVCQ